jgi:hypothetical protein
MGGRTLESERLMQGSFKIDGGVNVLDRFRATFWCGKLRMFGRLASSWRSVSTILRLPLLLVAMLPSGGGGFRRPRL